MGPKNTFPKRKHPRLSDKAIYSEPGTIVHIILCTKEKIAYFTNYEFADKFCEILFRTAKEFGNKLYAYCVMPDHVHFLLEASSRMGIIGFVKYVKGRYAKWCRENKVEVQFQKSFYDHVLRKEEDVYKVAKYIVGNPVRAGIVDELGKYPFAGSCELDI